MTSEQIRALWQAVYAAAFAKEFGEGSDETAHRRAIYAANTAMKMVLLDKETQDMMPLVKT